MQETVPISDWSWEETCQYADMVKSADTHDSKSCAARRVSSSLTISTILDFRAKRLEQRADKAGNFRELIAWQKVIELSEEVGRILSALIKKSSQSKI